MASSPSSRLTPDVRFALALSVDRQALALRQADWALSSVQVGSSHIYAQGQSGYHASPTTTSTTVPTASPTTSTSTSTTAVGQGGTVNFPVTPSPTQASSLMVASGYSRAGTGTWHNAFSLSLDLKLAVDESDPWAASTAPQLQAQLESAGYVVSLAPAPSAAAAGDLLSDGTADLALLPRTATPFLSETIGWYSNVLGTVDQNGSQDWSNYDNSTFDSLITKASEDLSAPSAAMDYQTADAQLWDDVVALPLFTEPSALISSRKVAEVTATPTNTSLLWYAQYWGIRVRETTTNTTPPLSGP
jgi:ABC-type transport system substrate-binding protein